MTDLAPAEPPAPAVLAPARAVAATPAAAPGGTATGPDFLTRPRPGSIAGYDFTLVPHTHWDREWYLPFEVFRIRLARTVEEICDVLDADPRFTSFTLDGQAVILDDVVELRPDLAPRLRRLIADGRLVTGPAYVLPDEFLASGEALVRNLLVGRTTCARYGAVPMAVGYMPDPFGHVGQLPQILLGFGLEAFVFWRGLGDEANRLGLAFAWEAPDGSRVTAVRQLGSYGNACQIGRWAGGGVDLAERPDRRPDVAAARLVRYVSTFDVELERTPVTALFLCNGADHERIQRDLPDLVEHAREQHAGTTIRIGSFEDYWRRLRRELPSTAGLPVVTGELVGGRDAPVLRGINSTRMPLKQAAERVERALTTAETLASLAVLGGRAPYPQAELGRAWREHLKNLPHDSISGCSVDEVHRDMAARFASVAQVAERIRREALAALAGLEERWSHRPVRSAHVSLVNPLAHRRLGVAVIPLPDALLDASSLIAVDATGAARAAQAADRGGERVALVLADLTGFGAEDVTLATRALPMPAVPLPGVTPAHAIDNDAITNGIVSVLARPDGTIDLTDERTGRIHLGLHRFEDVADRGDEYTFCPVEFDEPRSPVPEGEVRVTAAGPVLAELAVSTLLRLPERLSADRRRRVGAVEVPITTLVRLTAGSDRVEFVTTIDNRAEDHRLRVRFAVRGVDERSDVRAEGHFGVVRRTVRAAWSGAAWTEPPALTRHTAGFVAVGDVAVLGRGLPEYEAVPTAEGLDIALTLLRCVGWLSRDDLSTRPGSAGPTLPTPDAQCPGLHTFEYAVSIAPDTPDLDLLRASATFRTPPTVGPAGVATNGLLSLDGEVAWSALKGADDGDGLILRVFATDRESALRITAAASAARVRLDESPEAGLPDAPLRPGEIRTLRLRVGEAADR